jgi:hypothetical protein
MEIDFNNSNTKTIKDKDNNINNNIEKNSMCIDIINSNKIIQNDKQNENEIWSDEDNSIDNANLLDNFTNLFNFNTFFFYEDPQKKINKKLGSIMFLYDNIKYRANYSIHYPKIVYNNEIFDNLREWVKYIKKNSFKNNNVYNYIISNVYNSI